MTTGGTNLVADLALEQPCFVYHDSRDLTGFIDGTENPPIDQAAAIVTVPHGTPGAGRTKPDSIELDANPPTSHVSRVVIEDDDGEELDSGAQRHP